MPLERMSRVDLFEEMTLELVYKDGKESGRERRLEEFSRQGGRMLRCCSVKEPGVSEKQREGQCVWSIVNGRETMERFPGKKQSRALRL